MIEEEKQRILKGEIISNYLQNSEEKYLFKEAIKEIMKDDLEGWTTVTRRKKGKGKELETNRNCRKNTIKKNNYYYG